MRSGDDDTRSHHGRDLGCGDVNALTVGVIPCLHHERNDSNSMAARDIVRKVRRRIGHHRDRHELDPTAD